MKKSGLFIIVICICMGILTACETTNRTNHHSTSKEDKLEIYNSDNQKILETDDQEMIDFFANLVGMSAENIDEENYDEFFKEIPHDAKKSYHFVCTSKRIDKKATQIDFYIYENYPYITMEGMPLLPSSLTWKLEKEDLQMLQDYTSDIEKSEKEL